MSAGLPLVPTATAGDPSWAVPYDATRAFEAGEGWREHAERAARGMLLDPALEHAGWTRRWWEQLRHPSPAGADRNTWFQVSIAPLPHTDVYPCCQFSGWQRQDNHGHRVTGAPLQIAVYPGLWRKHDMPWSMGCYWAPYTRWTGARALERIWREAVQWSFHDQFGPWEGDEKRAEREAAELRERFGWHRRSAMLLWLATSEHLNSYVRDMAGHDGPGVERIRAGVIRQAAEHLCWQRAEDDLPWPEFAPQDHAEPKAARPAAIRPAERPGPRQLSLFNLAAEEGDR